MAAKKTITKVATKKSVAKKSAAPKKYAQRSDLGAPIDGFFTKQPAELREVLEALRAIIETTAPEATSAIKWGMPFYEIGGVMVCALGAFKSHVRLILAGPPESFDDPKRRLAGEGKSGRHLKLTSIRELPRSEVARWLRTTTERARREAKSEDPRRR